jgi:hypothetical protein
MPGHFHAHPFNNFNAISWRANLNLWTVYIFFIFFLCRFQIYAWKICSETTWMYIYRISYITVKSQNRLHRITSPGQIATLPNICVSIGLKTVCLRWNMYSELLAIDHMVLLDGRIYRSHGCISVQCV